MLKKSVAVILALLLVFSAFTVVSAAETGSGLEFTPAENIQTKITYTDDSVKIFTGAIDPESIEPSGIAEKISSYELLYNGESALVVDLNDIRSTSGDAVSAGAEKLINGYYSASFELTGQNKEMFITGINPSNLVKIQKAIVKSYVYDGSLDIEDLGFIDTEKTSYTEADDNLCWAATCSNMLDYSGWAQQAGFADTDDVFDEFVDSFYDGGFYPFNAMQWFFNGAKGCPENEQTKLKDYGKSGNYFPDIPADSVCANYTGFDSYPNLLKTLASSLRNGYAVGLGIVWGYKYNQAQGAHAITCWGYVQNNDYSDDDIRHYESLIISDSDSDILDYSDRRCAPNKLKVISMTPYSNPKMFYTGVIFNNYNDGILMEINTLAPYEEGKYDETDILATRDKLNTVDFLAKRSKVSTDSARFSDCYVFPHGEDAYIFADYMNVSDKQYNGDVEALISVFNSDGDLIASKTVKESKKFSNYADNFSEDYVKLDCPGVGKYTVTVTVDPEHKITEAFRSNNTNTTSFEVVETEYDTTHWGIAAEFSPFEGNEATVKLSYPGISNELMSTAGFGRLTYKYFLNGEWTQEGLVGFYRNGAMPDTFEVNMKQGTMIRFIMAFDVEGIDCVIKSVDIPISCDDARAIGTENNTFDHTPLEHGASSLAEGEKIAFTVKNISPDKRFDGTVNVIAEGTEGIWRYNPIQIAQFDLSLEAGESSQEYSYDSWEENPDLQGTFNIRVITEGFFEDETSCFDSCELGKIMIKELPSTVVDFNKTYVDAYDGVTSLIEAVDFCPVGGTVTFETDKVKQDGADVLFSEVDTLDCVLDKDITIDGRSVSRNGMTCGVEFAGVRFTVEQGAKVKLRGLKFDNYFCAHRDYGAGINSRGELEIEDCSFHNVNADYSGGAVYINGGSAKILNSTFEVCNGLNGGALAVNGGAKVDMLNCSVLDCSSSTGSVNNIFGELNIVNSDIVLGYTSYEKFDKGGAVNGNSVTRLVNCTLFSRENEDFQTGKASCVDAAGDVELYGCAFKSVADDVIADEQCIVYDKLIDVIDPDDPYIDAECYYKDECSMHKIAKLFDSVRGSGYIVSVRDGELVYSDGENTWTTGIVPAFEESAYAYDVIGTERSRAFGACSDTSKIGMAKMIGDVNGDRSVDILDAAMIQKYAANLVELSELQLDTADVNFDGNVDALDSTDIMKYTVGKIIEFVPGKG